MPNWCYVQENILGPKEEIRNLYKLLNKWTNKEYVKSAFGKNWLGNIVLGAGFEEDEFPYRGSIINDFKIRDWREPGIKYISFCSETAWGPMPEMWLEGILPRYAPNSSYHYIAEEPGMVVYEKYDPDNLFFKNVDYNIDAWLESTENLDKKTIKIIKKFEESNHYWKASALLSVLQKFFKTDEDDIDKLVDRFNKLDLGDNDCTINKYEVIV